MSEMSIPETNETARQCVAAFQYLCDDYGFDSPRLVQSGREENLYFTKGNRTVSINWEPGAFPLVELFYPDTTIEHCRIPHIRPSIGRGKNAMNAYLARAMSLTFSRSMLKHSGTMKRISSLDETSPNTALQRTAALAFSYRRAGGRSTGSVTACAPTMKPSTCRAFASRRSAHTRASGLRSLSFWSLGASTRIL
jgi:hypothetical protein